MWVLIRGVYRRSFLWVSSSHHSTAERLRNWSHKIPKKVTIEKEDRNRRIRCKYVQETARSQYCILYLNEREKIHSVGEANQKAPGCGSSHSRCLVRGAQLRTGCQVKIVRCFAPYDSQLTCILSRAIYLQRQDFFDSFQENTHTHTHRKWQRERDT